MLPTLTTFSFTACWTQALAYAFAGRAVSAAHGAEFGRVPKEEAKAVRQVDGLPGPADQGHELAFPRAQSDAPLASDEACHQRASHVKLDGGAASPRSLASSPVCIRDGLHDHFAAPAAQAPEALVVEAGPGRHSAEKEANLRGLGQVAHNSPQPLHGPTRWGRHFGAQNTHRELDVRPGVRQVEEAAHRLAVVMGLLRPEFLAVVGFEKRAV